MDRSTAIEELKQCYPGFFLKDPVGNNVFSFEQRQLKEIYVSPLIGGDLDDVKMGKEVVFSEIVDGKEKNSLGLENFVHWQFNGKDIFIFDHHHHAFMFWSFGLMIGAIVEGGRLVHVDQHKDTRRPDRFLEKRFWRSMSFSQIADYVNHDLNVGNFIDPALRSGMFGELIMVDHEQAFEQEIEAPCAVDIDLDIFSPDMDYICRKKKIAFIRHLIQQSQFITIATSPHFIDQESAFFALKELFNFS